MLRRLLAALAARLIADDPYQWPDEDDDDDNDNDPGGSGDGGEPLPPLPLPPDAPPEQVAAWEREFARRRQAARNGALLYAGAGGFEALWMTQEALVAQRDQDAAMDQAIRREYWTTNASATHQYN